MSARRLSISGLAALVVSLASSVSGADVLVDTASYVDQAVPQRLEVDRFDPALGTLNGATLTFTSSLVGSAGVFNSSLALNLTNVRVTVFGSLIANLLAGGPAALPPSVSLVGPNAQLGSRIFVILGPGARTSTGAFTLSNLPLVQTFTGTALQSFVGLGTFGFDFASSAQATVPANFTSVVLTPAATSSASITIQYDYTPTPSPVPSFSGPGLILLGIASVGAMLRAGSRRR